MPHSRWCTVVIYTTMRAFHRARMIAHCVAAQHIYVSTHKAYAHVYIHRHTYTHIHTRTLTHFYNCTQEYSRTYTCTNVRTRTYTNAYIRRPPGSYTNEHPSSRTHTHVRARTKTHTHTHTHLHTHTNTHARTRTQTHIDARTHTRPHTVEAKEANGEKKQEVEGQLSTFCSRDDQGRDKDTDTSLCQPLLQSSRTGIQ